MKDNYCYLIDSGMSFYRVKQDTLQKLFNDKILKNSDIEECLGCEDIADVLENIIVNFNCYNKYDIQYIIDYLNDIMCELESEED